MKYSSKLHGGKSQSEEEQCRIEVEENRTREEMYSNQQIEKQTDCQAEGQQFAVSRRVCEQTNQTADACTLFLPSYLSVCSSAPLFKATAGSIFLSSAPRPHHKTSPVYLPSAGITLCTHLSNAAHLSKSLLCLSGSITVYLDVCVRAPMCGWTRYPERERGWHEENNSLPVGEFRFYLGGYFYPGRCHIWHRKTIFWLSVAAASLIVSAAAARKAAAAFYGDWNSGCVTGWLQHPVITIYSVDDQYVFQVKKQSRFLLGLEC